MEKKKGVVIFNLVETESAWNFEFLSKKINALLDALSRSGKGKKIDSADLAAVLMGFHFRLYLVEYDGEIVGMGSLYFRQTLTRHVAYIEDVSFLKEFQDRGLGTLLLGRLIEEARKNNVDFIELTSHPEREAANAFYRKLGFKQPETNLYRYYFHK